MHCQKLLAAILLIVTTGVVRADDDDTVNPASWLRSRTYVAPLNCPPCQPYYLPGNPSTVPNTTDPNNPVPPNNPPQNQDPTNPFATATPGGGLQGRSFNETFDGDFGGTYYSETILVGYTTTTKTTYTIINNDGMITKIPHTITVTVPEYKTIHVPVSGAYSGVLITDNDSPRPTDRAYFGYNYYSGIGSSINGYGINENREMIGFEKTVLDGNGSIGMRLPFIQYNGLPGATYETAGDLSILFKYAFYNNRETGDVVSAGMIITTPTSGSNGVLSNGLDVPRSVLFQPWLGFVKMIDRAYIEGITDVVIPTNARDTFVWTNSLATGYWLYQNFDDRILNGIIPTLELHCHTPLNNNSIHDLIYAPDELNLTAGVHFRFPRATLTGAVSFPMIGPHPYNSEVIVNLNFWF